MCLTIYKYEIFHFFLRGEFGTKEEQTSTLESIAREHQFPPTEDEVTIVNDKVLLSANWIIHINTSKGWTFDKHEWIDKISFSTKNFNSELSLFCHLILLFLLKSFHYEVLFHAWLIIKINRNQLKEGSFAYCKAFTYIFPVPVFKGQSVWETIHTRLGDLLNGYNLKNLGNPPVEHHSRQ